MNSYLNLNKELNIDIIEQAITVLIQRLNQIPYPETSEELRLFVIKLIQSTLKKQKQAFLPKLAELANMLHKSLLDQFPDMKKQASLLAIDISEILGKYIGGYLINVVKSVSLNMGHQHSRVRKQSVECLAPLLLCESSGPFLDQALGNLKQLTLDKSADVRKASFNCIAELLKHFSVPNLVLFENELLVLLLNGLSDDSEEIQNFTLLQLDEIGLKREQLDKEIGQQI